MRVAMPRSRRRRRHTPSQGGFLVLLAVASTAAVAPGAARADQDLVWVRHGPVFFSNGAERKPRNAQVDEHSFTVHDAAGRTNTLTWSPPPLILEPGNEVRLELHCSTNEGAPLLGHWVVSDCGERDATVVDEQAASWQGGKRSATFSEGRVVFPFKAGSSPTISIQAGRYDDYGGDMTGRITWTYARGKRPPEAPSDERPSVSVSLEPGTLIMAPYEILDGKILFQSANAERGGIDVCIGDHARTTQLLDGLRELNATIRAEDGALGTRSAGRYAALIRSATVHAHRRIAPASMKSLEVPLGAFSVRSPVGGKDAYAALSAPAEEGEYRVVVIGTAQRRPDLGGGVALSWTTGLVKITKAPKRIFVVHDPIVTPPQSPPTQPRTLSIAIAVQGLDPKAAAPKLMLEGSIEGSALPASGLAVTKEVTLSTAKLEGDEFPVGRAVVNIPCPALATAGEYRWESTLSIHGFPAVEALARFTVLPPTGPGDPDAVVQGSCRVRLVGGEAWVQNDNGEFVPLDDGAVIAPGHRIRTGPGGVVSVTFPDGASVRLLYHTTVWVNQGGHIVMEGTGAVSDVTHPPEATPSAHDIVHTPLATIEPDGTRFDVQHRRDITTIVVHEGAVRVTPTTPGQRPFRLVAGQSARVSAAGVENPADGDVAGPFDPSPGDGNPFPPPIGGGSVGGGADAGARVLATSKAAYAAGEDVVVRYADAGGNALDYIAIGKPGVDRLSTWTGADLSVTNPYSSRAGDDRQGLRTFSGIAEGSYEARYIRWNGGNHDLVASSPFTVGAGSSSGPAGGGGSGDALIQLDVPSDRAWTPTGVALAPGDCVRIEAYGAIEASLASDARFFFHGVPPSGRDEFLPTAPQPLLRALSLIGRIGSGPVLRIGALTAKLCAIEPYGVGELSLGINDDTLHDNSGVWHVRIFVRRATPSGSTPESPGVTPTDTLRPKEFPPTGGRPEAPPSRPRTPEAIPPLPRTPQQAGPPPPRTPQAVPPPRGVPEAVPPRPPPTKLVYSVRPSKLDFAAGEAIRIDFSVTQGTTSDMICIQRAPAKDEEFLAIQETQGAISGSLSFASLPTGAYEACYMAMVDGSGTIQARGPFRVGEGEGHEPGLPLPEGPAPVPSGGPGTPPIANPPTGRTDPIPGPGAPGAGGEGGTTGVGAVWVCDGAVVTNGNGQPLTHPELTATATSVTFTRGGSQNTLTWTQPPMTLREGDAVSLTITSTTAAAPYLSAGYYYNCAKGGTATGDNTASNHPLWRATSPHQGTIRFVFAPEHADTYIVVRGGNTESDGGPSSSVSVAWKYRKQR